MKTVEFRFYEELNDFLPQEFRKVSFEYTFEGNHAVKEIIESLGVPHAEIDLIVVNGESVGFDYQLSNHDRVAVYPVFEALDISNSLHLRPKPLRTIKFILDSHLGRLAKYLRMCGFDTYYQPELDDLSIIDIAKSEKRIILTKDRDLLKNKNVTHGYWVRKKDTTQQFIEIMRKFDLGKQICFLTRCLICNTPVTPVSKNQIGHLVSPKTIQYYDEFFLCPNCSKVYWKGSHYENMLILLKKCNFEINSSVS